MHSALLLQAGAPHPPSKVVVLFALGLMKSPVAQRLASQSPPPSASGANASKPGQSMQSPFKDDASEASSVFACMQGMQRIQRGGGFTSTDSAASPAKGEQPATVPPPAPHAESKKGKGKAQTNKAAEQEGKRPAKRKGTVAFCYVCQCTTEDWTSKSECRPCNNDKESAKRDCLRQNQKAYWDEISKDKEALGAFVRAWVEEVGPSRGFGNSRGGFKIAKYIETLRTTHEYVKGQEKVMKTKIEFRDAMVAKGMGADWALEEFKRRRSRPDIWDCDDDPDCQLPRVQMHGKTKKEDNEISARDRMVSAESAQIRNPNAQKFEGLLKNFGDKESTEVRGKTFESLHEGRFAELTAEANTALVSDFTPRSFLEKLEQQHNEKVEAAVSAGSETPKDLTLSLENADNADHNKGKVLFFDAGRFLSDEKSKADKLALKMQQQLETASCDNCLLCIVVCCHRCVALSLVNFFYLS